MKGQRFKHGHIVATPGALEAFQRTNESPQGFLQRHLSGDWGEVDEQDRQENNYSL